MSKDLENLREAIRKILEQQNSLSEERIDGEREVLDWIRFEQFGWEVLREIKYQGEYESVLKKVKRLLEDSDGWEFEDTSEGIW